MVKNECETSEVAQTRVAVFSAITRDQDSTITTKASTQHRAIVMKVLMSRK